MAPRKGMRARAATTFKRDHSYAGKSHVSEEEISSTNPPSADVAPRNKAYKRLTIEEYHRVVSPPVKSDEKQRNDFMFLRPLIRTKSELETIGEPSCNTAKSNLVSEVDGYRLVHMPTMVRAYHEAIKEHRNADGTCAGILVAIAEHEIKRGVGVEEVFGCTQCSFKSDQHALYKELPQKKPGRNPCDLNVAMQLALYNTCISSSGAQRFLSCMSLPSPALSGLQKTANKFGPIMEHENERDMSVKRHIVQDILELRGLKKDTPICAEFDRQYNNPLRNGRKKTPFAPATQCRDVLVENVTPDKFVIGFNHTNKLCAAGHAKRRKTEPVQCPGHEGCSATIDAGYNIGNEEAGGRTTATNLLQGPTPLKIGHLTTDADGKGFQGFKAIMGDLGGTATENLLDEQHLNRSFCRAVTKANFSGQMFPAKKSTERNLIKKRFAEDLSHRVQIEINACRKAHDFNIDKVIPAMKECTVSIIECYKGNHQECHRKSHICTTKKTYHFPYMPSKAKGSLQILTADKEKLKRLIGARTCEKILHMTRFATSTQKAEAMNSAFKMTNPKHSQTFSRNGRFRDHSAIHLVNNGPGISIALKMAALGLHPCNASIKTLRQMQRLREYGRSYQRKFSQKVRRARLRRKRYKLHEKQNISAAGYKKDQLIPQLMDHTYFTGGQ